jgi:hypothetical protein
METGEARVTGKLQLVTIGKALGNGVESASELPYMMVNDRQGRRETEASDRVSNKQQYCDERTDFRTVLCRLG